MRSEKKLILNVVTTRRQDEEKDDLLVLLLMMQLKLNKVMCLFKKMTDMLSEENKEENIFLNVMES